MKYGELHLETEQEIQRGTMIKGVVKHLSDGEHFEANNKRTNGILHETGKLEVSLGKITRPVIVHILGKSATENHYVVELYGSAGDAR